VQKTQPKKHENATKLPSCRNILRLGQESTMMSNSKSHNWNYTTNALYTRDRSLEWSGQGVRWHDRTELAVTRSRRHHVMQIFLTRTIRLIIAISCRRTFYKLDTSIYHWHAKAQKSLHRRGILLLHVSSSQPEVHWSCFQATAKDIFVRTVLAHPAH